VFEKKLLASLRAKPAGDETMANVTLLCGQLKRIATEKRPFTIVVADFNTNDGIGDAVSTLTTYQLLQQWFADQPAIKVHALLFIGKDYLPKLVQAMKGRIDIARQTNMISTENPGEHTADKPISIISIPRFSTAIFNGYQYIEIIVPCLKSLLARCDLFLNIATPLAEQNNPRPLLKKNCQIYSILEMGDTTNFMFRNQDDIAQHRRVNMGVHADDAGFYFDNELVVLTKLASQSPDRLLAMLSNKSLKTLLFADRTIEAYRKRSKLVCGYLQKPAALRCMLLMVRQCYPDKDIDVLVNLSNVKTAFLEECLQHFSEVRLYKNDGGRKNKYSSKAGGNRKLRLIDFAGTLNRDKNIFCTLANVTLASGDNSFNEALTSGKLPFIHVQKWKQVFLRLLIRYFPQMELELNVLPEYLLKLADVSRYDYVVTTMQGVNDLATFFAKHHEQLQKEWLVLREWLLNNRNYSHYVLWLCAELFSQRLCQQADSDLTSAKQLVDTFAAKLHGDDPAREPGLPIHKTLLEYFNRARVKIVECLQEDSVDRLKQVLAQWPFFEADYYQFCIEASPLLQLAMCAGAKKCFNHLLSLSTGRPWFDGAIYADGRVGPPVNEVAKELPNQYYFTQLQARRRQSVPLGRDHPQAYRIPTDVGQASADCSAEKSCSS